MNKEAKKCEATLCCKATASLKRETDKELDKEDKPLKELLDEKQPKSERQ